MDKTAISRGLQRAPLGQFLLWLGPWIALLVFGVYCAYLCLRYGLHLTNMDNRFAFGAWIFLDLTVIALGAGAFTGFCSTSLSAKELRAVINSAVTIGFICYSGAVVILMVDVGQPLRLGLPSGIQMSTRCLLRSLSASRYLGVLAFEYIPILLKIASCARFRHSWSLNSTCTRSCMSLPALELSCRSSIKARWAGCSGVLNAALCLRESFGIWPTTFFVHRLRCCWPSFILLTTWITSKVTKKRLVTQEVYESLGKISGYILIGYVLFKTIDTLCDLHDSPWNGSPSRLIIRKQACVYLFASVRSHDFWLPAHGYLHDKAPAFTD